jgi:hypothetical protein
MARVIYSDEQLAFLRAKCTKWAIGKLTAAFNARFGLAKTEGQIRATQKNHKIRGGRGQKKGARSRKLFTARQAAFIARTYKNISVVELTAAVNEKFKLALEVSQLRSYVRNHGVTSGRTGCFVQGSLPWNTGTKDQGVCKANRGTFTKGNIPGNIKPLGDERICPKDGFILVKIKEANPYTGADTRYKHKHVVVWEREHGPVPEGYVVRLIDGDKTNCEPENLLLVTRAEHLRLNQLGVAAYPPELRPTVVAIAKLEVKTFGRRRREKEGKTERRDVR